MALAKAFNSAITPCVEHKKRSKEATHITKSLGMEISGSKKANFNFDSLETSSDANFNLLDPSMTCHKSKPRSASCMASNSHAYTTIISSATLSFSEGAPEFANKEFEIKLVPFKDDLMQPNWWNDNHQATWMSCWRNSKFLVCQKLNFLKLIMV
jgi:hypothetical protein